MKKRLKVLMSVLFCILFVVGCGQKGNSVDSKYSEIQEKDFKNYLEKVDTEYAHKIALDLGEFKQNQELGYRTAGSSAEYEAGKYLEKEMKNIGLTEVSADEIRVDKWEFEKANLIFKDKSGNEVKSVLGGYQINFDTKGEKEFDIVYAGKGTKDDYENIDVTGKLVLLDINQREEWWVNYPTLQAHFKGAAAVIVAQDGGYSEVDDKALNAQDICGPDYAPVFSISKADRNVLKEAIDNGNTKVKLDAKSKVDFDQKTYNYIGKIEGKDKDNVIVYSAHYDAYFSGLQDNSMAVGLMMSIAKAMVESGYQPDKTIVFAALSAEEWGVSNTRYDWSTGAYRQINEARPEWIGNALLDINFELPAYEHETHDEIRAIYELKNYLTDFSKLVPKVDGVYKDGIEVVAPLRTWSDDFSFATSGIPALRNDFQDSEFMKTHYHTQMDDKETYNEKALKFHQNLYGLLGIYYDKTAVVPLDFSNRMEALKESINAEMNKSEGTEYKELIAESDRAISNAKEVMKKVEKLNQDYKNALVNNEPTDGILKASKELNSKLLETFKYAESNLVRLTWEDEPIFAHQNPQTNIEALSNSKGLIEKGDVTKALDEELYKVDNNWYAYSFDKDVFEYFTNYVINAEKGKLMWSAGKVVSHRDLYDLINSLQEKGDGKEYSAELEIISKSIKEEQEILKQTVAEELKSVKEINNLLESIK